MPQFIRNSASAAIHGFGFARARGRRRRSRLGVASLALYAATIGLTVAARAEIIQIPAITFVGRSDVDLVGDATLGVLTNAHGTFYAPVPFPASGQVVCRFTLVHRDNDDLDITARLLKKGITVGGNPFVEPEPLEMAIVQTAGASAGVQKQSDRRIRKRIIDLAHAFYYVELTLPGTLLEVLGVQIDVRPEC